MNASWLCVNLIFRAIQFLEVSKNSRYSFAEVGYCLSGQKNYGLQRCKMKILFVCVDRYPYDGACTSLLKKVFFKGGLVGNGNEIHITTYQQHFDDKNEETIDSVVIHRLLSPRFLSISELMRHKKNLRFFFTGMCIKLKKFFEQKLNNGGANLDKGQIKEFENFMRKICAKESFNVIVGVAGCYEMTIAGQAVSKEKKIPFILYQVDPFTDNVMFSSKFATQRMKIEKELYINSKKIFTTKFILSEMMKRLSLKELTNVEILEFPGVSVNRTPYINIRNKDYIECIFAGRVYKGVRNPSFIIKLFQKFPINIRLKLYGVSLKELRDKFSITSLPSNVECCGLVRVEKAENVIRNADVLVNIGNIMLNQVPSKLFSYISTGKPILNVCSNHDCPSKKYLEQYPCVMSIDEESFCSESVVKKTLAFLTENAGKVCDLNEIEAVYEKCTPVYAASRMRVAFLQACKEK